MKFHVVNEYSDGSKYVNGFREGSSSGKAPISHQGLLDRIPDEYGYSKTRSNVRLTSITIEVIPETTEQGDALREIAKNLGGSESGIARELNEIATKIDNRA